jgi:hypothetical protein
MIAESRGYLAIDSATAEAMAIDALAFLAGNPTELGRFLALSGIGPETLRQAAADPGFLAGVLDHIMTDDSLLLAFAGTQGLDARAIAAAARRLRSGPDEETDNSPRKAR